MLVLPIINKNNIMNVEVSLKTANRIRQKVSFEDFGESEIVVNNEKISDSIYKDSKEKTAPIDFIRNKSIIYKRPYLLTTRYYLNSELYDINSNNEYINKSYISKLDTSDGTVTINLESSEEL